MSYPSYQSLAPVRVLVTGFGPFPGVPFNASASVIETIAKTFPIPGIKLFAEVIPVAWDQAIECSQNAIAKCRPHAVLHFGVAKKAAVFEIETRAFNMSGPKKDHSGRARGERVLERGSPLIRTSTLPARRLLQALRQTGYPAVLSKDAGRYLCNAIFFSSLSDADSKGGPHVSFVHMPAFGIKADIIPRMSLNQAVNGARILVRASAEAVLRAEASRSDENTDRRHSNGSQGLYGNGRGRGRIFWRDR